MATDTGTRDMRTAKAQLRDNVRRLADLWWDTPTTLPDLGPCPGEARRQARADEMDALLAHLLEQAQQPPAAGAGRAA